MNAEIYESNIPKLEFIKAFHEKIFREYNPDEAFDLDLESMVNVAIKFYYEHIKDSAEKRKSFEESRKL